jgi:hypothetical protein
MHLRTNVRRQLGGIDERSQSLPSLRGAADLVKPAAGGEKMIVEVNGRVQSTASLR